MTNRTPPVTPLFRALADPTRLAVVERLMQGPATVSDLAAPHAIALPTFLRHLQVLQDCGLVRTEKTGRVRTCVIEAGALATAEDWLARQRRAWEARTDRLQEFLEQGHDLADGPRSATETKNERP
jgi:DNA-binding transcriptional ArsR family regulator